MDEAWLPSVAADLEPRIVLLANLFRDQLDRYGELESLADRWAELTSRPDGPALVLNADDPLVADLGRGRDRVTYFGVEDDSQALPELQHAADSKHCRNCGAAVPLRRRVPRPPGPLPLPELRPRAPHAAGGRHARGARRHGRVGRGDPHPAGELAIRLPLPGLYNVYNAVAAAATALELGVAPGDVVAALEGFGGAFGRVETIPVAGRELSILLVKNPAGANEVLRTLVLEDGPLDLWLALNDRTADGRDVSWIWDADFELLRGRVRRAVCSGTRAEDMAVRLKYAELGGEIAVDRDLERSLDAAVEGAGGTRALRPPHLHGAAGPARPAGPPRAGRAVVGLRGATAAWHDVECASYAADLELWRELAAAAAPAPVLDLGAGTGRVALDLAGRGHAVTAVDSDAELVAELARRARERGLRVDSHTGGRPHARPGTPLRARLRRHAGGAAAGRVRRAAEPSSRGCASTWSPAAASPPRWPTRSRRCLPSTPCRPCPTWPRWRAGCSPAGRWTCAPSRAAWRCTGCASSSRPPAT